jgi:sugar phosphate isomerase/epimerase
VRLGLEAGPNTLDLAVELGVGGVPIGADKLVADGVEATLAPLRERGLEVCQIGAFGYNPLLEDADRLAAQRALLSEAIDLAPETGCKYLVICGGNYHPSGFGGGDTRNFSDATLDRVATELKPLLSRAEAQDVYLSIEPYLKTAICSPERFLKLKERVDSEALKVNLDVTSFYDLSDMWNPANTVEHVCETLSGHYGLGHVKGIALKDGFHIHIDLAPLADDPTDWAQVLRLAQPHLPDDSWMILEHVQTPEEARDSMARLRVAATEAGVILS